MVNNIMNSRDLWLNLLFVFFFVLFVWLLTIGLTFLLYLSDILTTFKAFLTLIFILLKSKLTSRISDFFVISAETFYMKLWP